MHLQDEVSQFVINPAPKRPGCFASEIIEREKAGQRSVRGDHRESTRAIEAHQLRRGTQIIVGLASYDFPGHRSLNP